MCPQGVGPLSFHFRHLAAPERRASLPISPDLARSPRRRPPDLARSGQISSDRSRSGQTPPGPRAISSQSPHRSTKMRCEMHELNAPLWTECRQNAKKNAENAQKCTSQKRYQFVAKTVLTPGKEPEPWRASTGEHGLLLKIFVRPSSTPASELAGILASLRAPRAHGRAVDHELTMPRRCRACNGPRRAPLQPRRK